MVREGLPAPWVRRAVPRRAALRGVSRRLVLAAARRVVHEHVHVRKRLQQQTRGGGSCSTRSPRHRATRRPSPSSLGDQTFLHIELHTS